MCLVPENLPVRDLLAGKTPLQGPIAYAFGALMPPGIGLGLYQ